MNFELIIFLVFTVYISVINSEKDSDEGKYIDLLPEEEKKDLLEKIALRILEEVQSNSTDVKSGEISDAQLNHHSQYVSNLLQEERENLRRKNNATVNAIKKKRNARSSDYDSIKVQGIEKDKTINEGVSNKLDNIDFTLREAKLTKNVKKKTKATIVLTTSTTEDFKTTDTGSITESSMDVIKSKLTNKNGRIVEIIDSDSSDDDRNDNNKHKPMKNSSRNVKGPDNTQIPVKIVYDNPTNPIQDKVGDRKSIDTEYPITGKVILYRDDSDVTKMYDFDPETTPDSDETITTPDTQTAKTNTVDDKNEATKETALTKSTVDNNLAAGNTAFVLKNINGKKKEVNVPENHLERRTDVEETKYYVPVYNYAPNNAYFNPYNRLGPNADDKDRETDNFETKDTLGEERGGDVSDNSEFENSGEYNRKYNYNQPYRSPHRSFVQQPNVVDHANDYFDMDYYFGRTNDRPNHKGREWRRKKEEKLNFNLGLRNSYDKDHSIERGKLKDLISDVRLLLHRNNIHLPIPDHSTTETEFDNTKSNGNKMKSPNNILRYSKYNRGNFLSLPYMKQINPYDIGIDYYVGRGQKTKIDLKQNQETPNLLMNYDSDYDNDDYRLLQDKSKKLESSKEEYYRSIVAELNNYQMKTKNQIKPFINKETMQMLTNMSDAKDVLQILLQLQQMQRARDSLLNPYLTVIEDMIKTDNKGLSQYDWLGSAVDVQAALKKMVDLTKQSQFGRNIHQSDLELLYYLSYLYQSAKDYLAASRKDQMQYNIHEDNKYLSKSTDNLSKINKYIYFNDYFDPRNKKFEYDKSITKGKVTLNDFLSEVKKLNLKEPSPLNIKEYLQRIKDVSLPNIRIFYPMKGKEIKRLDIPKDIEVKYNSNNDLEEKLLGILKDHSDKLKTFKPSKVFKVEDLPRDINMDKISIDLSTLKRLKLHRRLNPRTQHKKSYRRLVNDVSPLVTIFHQPGESNFEDNLKEFRNDLIETQYALNDLHNAIKYISMVSKPNLKLFRNLRELYLTNPTKKLAAEVLLHLTATRLIGLVEDSFKQDLGKDYLKYIEDNEETVRKTRDEFVFVLRLLEEIKDLEE